MKKDTRTLNWSKYQKAVFEEYQESWNNITIQATAGSGKSTVIKHACRLVPFKRPRAKKCFLAFNKSIADELKKHLPTSVPAKTIHSIGLYALRKHYDNNIIVKQNKYYDIILPMVLREQELFKKPNKDAFILATLLNYYRLFLCVDVGELEERLKELKVDYAPQHIHFLPVVLDKVDKVNNRPITKTRKLIVDFTDMIYIPAVNEEIVVDQYDEVFVDEAQDASALMQMLIFKLKKDDGRFIVVGDPKQAIYSFLGSSPIAFNEFTQYPNTTNLSLPLTYRCGKAIVDSVKDLFPEMEVFEGNSEGFVGTGSIDHSEAGDIILCRNNKPLFDAYIHLVVQGKKAVIKDKDLGKKLINIVEKHKQQTTEGLMSSLRQRLHQIYEELKERGVNSPSMHPRYSSFDDNIQIIERLCGEVGDVRQLLKFMKNIFKEEDDRIELMTMHKSKGLEANNVYIIREDLLFGKKVITKTQIVQEKNLKFVAYTRAKNRLIFDRTFIE